MYIYTFFILLHFFTASTTFGRYPLPLSASTTFARYLLPLEFPL